MKGATASTPFIEFRPSTGGVKLSSSATRSAEIEELVESDRNRSVSQGLEPQSLSQTVPESGGVHQPPHARVCLSVTESMTSSRQRPGAHDAPSADRHGFRQPPGKKLRGPASDRDQLVQTSVLGKDRIETGPGLWLSEEALAR